MKLLIIEDDDKLRTESPWGPASPGHRSSGERWKIPLPELEKKDFFAYCDHYQPRYRDE